MSDPRLERLVETLVREGYLDNEMDARRAAMRILWAVDDRRGEPSEPTLKITPR
jgi:hypothetical protein